MPKSKTSCDWGVHSHFCGGGSVTARWAFTDSICSVNFLIWDCTTRLDSRRSWIRNNLVTCKHGRISYRSPKKDNELWKESNPAEQSDHNVRIAESATKNNYLKCKHEKRAHIPWRHSWRMHKGSVQQPTNSPLKAARWRTATNEAKSWERRQSIKLRSQTPRPCGRKLGPGRKSAYCFPHLSWFPLHGTHKSSSSTSFFREFALRCVSFVSFSLNVLGTGPSFPLLDRYPPLSPLIVSHLVQ